MTPEERKEYDRLYYIKNKEKKNEQNRNNHHKNKENRNEHSRLYSKTDKGQKSSRIRRWKYKGVICEDFDKMYDIYNDTKNCSWCNKEFGKKNIEHNHSSGQIRGIVCHTCNQKIACKDKNYQKVMSNLVSLFIQ